MRDLSLHILDIAENSIDAGAARVEVSISEDTKRDTFTLSIVDDGRGMDKEILQKTEDPFFTLKGAKRFGLGIPLLAQAARECGGHFEIKSQKGRGTTVVAGFQLSHIDCKPLGDVGATMMTLVAGHPETDYVLVYDKDGRSFRLDTAEIRRELQGVPLNVPDVLNYIRDNINDGIRRVRG